MYFVIQFLPVEVQNTFLITLLKTEHQKWRQLPRFFPDFRERKKMVINFEFNVYSSEQATSENL